MPKGYTTPRQYGRFDTVSVQASNLETMLESVSLASDTIDARVFASGDDVNISPTKEQVITSAIAYAASQGKSRVYLAKSLEGYNAALVTFNSAVQLVTETQLNGPASTLGSNTINAANYVSTSKELGIQAAINAAVAQGKTAVFVPASMLPYDASQVIFNTAVHMIYEGDPDLRHFNVEAYGANRSLSIDSSAAVLAAIAAANASSDTGGARTIFFPFLCKITSPRVVDTVGLRFEGMDQGYSSNRSIGTGQAQCGLYASGFHGPMVYVARSDATFSDLTTSLATGSGNALNIQSGGLNRWINLRDCKNADLNGLSAFCFRLFFKGSGSFGAMLSSNGVWARSDTAQSAFLLQVNSLFKLQIDVNLSGGAQTLQGSAHAIDDGLVHHLAVTYDGSTLRLFTDGTLTASTAASGTLVQHPIEHVSIGGRVQFAPDQNIDYGPFGTVDSVELRNAVTYTAGFTVPTAKHTADTNTLVLCNFDLQSGKMTRAYTSGDPAWVVQRDAVNGSPLHGFRADGMAFVSDTANKNYGMYWGHQIANPSITRCSFSNLRASLFAPQGNHFQWRISETFHNSVGQYAIAMGIGSGDGHLDTAWIYGGQFSLYFGTGNILIDNVHIVFATGGNDYAGLSYIARDVALAPLHIRNLTVDTESGVDSTFRASVILSGTALNDAAGAHLDACTLTCRNGVPFLICDTTNCVEISNSMLFVADAVNPANVMKYQGTIYQPVVFRNNRHNITAAFSWSDTAGTATVDLPGLALLAFSATPTLDFSTASKVRLGALTANVTAQIWQNAGDGQPIIVIYQQNNVGGFTVAAPSNATGFGVPSTAANSISAQPFVYDQGLAKFVAIGPMVEGL